MKFISPRKINLLLGLLGLAFLISSFGINIIGAVIGTNTTSRFMGFFGIVLMIIAIILERHELKKHKKLN